MRDSVRLGLLVACCAALAFPASAAAIKCAPPGNAGVDQYFETVPGSSCNRGTTGPGNGPGGGSHGSLPPGTSSQLSKQGPVGQAVERLVSSSGTNGRRTGANGSRTGAALSGSASGPLSALLDPLASGSSSGGVGILLPIFLGVALVLVVLAVIARRMLGSSGPEA
jgi:hypothetical protein